MSATPTDDTVFPLVLRPGPVLELSDDQLLALCEMNRAVWIERNAKGELLLLPPAGAATSARNAAITTQLRIWARRDRSGVATGPSTGFRLPNGAMRAPSASWILRSRLEAVPADERAKFPPLCPDFVIELRSPWDALRDLQAKMDEWLANGARLGWLIDPIPGHLYVYRPGAPVERLKHPLMISADPLLPGFVLDLTETW
jgi:Uma2 family endonuclease